VPPLRRWAARKASQAYHHGFIQGIAQDPKAAVLAIIDNEAGLRTSAQATAKDELSEQLVTSLQTHNHKS
jgi:hypothetical protein